MHLVETWRTWDSAFTALFYFVCQKLYSLNQDLFPFIGISTDPICLFSEPSGTHRELLRGILCSLLSCLKPHCGFRAQRDSGVQTLDRLTWNVTQEL